MVWNPRRDLLYGRRRKKLTSSFLVGLVGFFVCGVFLGVGGFWFFFGCRKGFSQFSLSSPFPIKTKKISQCLKWHSNYVAILSECFNEWNSFIFLNLECLVNPELNVHGSISALWKVHIFFKLLTQYIFFLFFFFL